MFGTSYRSVPAATVTWTGADLYDVPNMVYSACDEEGVKVARTAPEVMRLVGDAAGDAVHGREVRRDITVSVTGEGTVRVRE